jgi:DNA modification methylase
MGSGTTAIACLNTNRNFIGFELDREYFQLAQRRIDRRRAELRAL